MSDMRGVSHLGAGRPNGSGPYSSALGVETVSNLLRRDSGRLLLGRGIRRAVSLFLSRIERLDQPGDQAAEFGGVRFFGYQLAEFLDQLFRIDVHILLHLAFLHLGAD